MFRCRLGIAILAIPSICFAADDSLKPILDLHQAGKLFTRSEYPAARGAAARVFATRHEKDLAAAFGEDQSALNEFLDKNKELKEELFSGINTKKDAVRQVLQVFRALWKADAASVAKYPNLAIAISLVWDDPENVYDYRHHQKRTKSILPEDYLKYGPVEEMKYHVAKAKAVQGKEGMSRLESLPWEFLLYVVDHRTPLGERDWAITNYLPKRPMIGKIYHDIEYDDIMLQTRSAVCKLNGHDYTFQDIKKYGGVCAMQADFAARVGKSLAVPAAYVRGEAQGGEYHAWVMWVEVKSATKSSVQFSLESWGRYREDNYYTGELIDPQTGEEILDRDMERRLSAAALDRTGKRLADLAMAYFAEIASSSNLDSTKRIQFLKDVLKLAPMTDAAWLELARMAKSGETTPENKNAILEQTNRLVTIFAKYPDFSYKVANDLITVQPDKTTRNRFFESLITMYENGKRPDLSCEARLKWADFVTEEKKWSLAATGLSQTLKKFPDEGRYVPKLLEKMTKVCTEFPGGTDYMAKTYVELVKKMNPVRGDEIVRHFSKTSREALTYLRINKKKKEAEEVERVMRGIGIKDI